MKYTPSTIILHLSILLIFHQTPSAFCDERGVTIQSKGQTNSRSSYDRSNFHALIIGINDYDNLPDLQSAVNDAESLAEVLKTYYGFENINLLLNQQATRIGILKKLGELRDTLDEEDSLLIYYAGHGRLKNNNMSLGYWAPSDGFAGNDVLNDISNSILVEDYLKLLKVKHLLLISDSCFSGSLFRGGASQIQREENIYKRFSKPSRMALTSGNDSPVPDDAGNGNSPFCNRLLQYLKSSLTPFDVWDIFYNIKDVLDSDPLVGEIDTPAHQKGGSFVLIPKDLPQSPADLLTAAFKRAAKNTEKKADLLPKEVSPPEPEQYEPTEDIEDVIINDTNIFVIQNPIAGKLTINGKVYDLANQPELELGKGTYPFSLQISGTRRIIYGKFEVLIVDDDTKNAMFGMDESEDPFFKQHHINAALKGSPVRYKIGLTVGDKKKLVAKYTLSLRKLK